MTKYPPHIYIGIFDPMLRIHRTLFYDLANIYPDLSIIAHPGTHLDADDTLNMLRIYQIPDERIHVIPRHNTDEQFISYLNHAEKIFCDFYREKGELILHDEKKHQLFESFIHKISWIEIAEEHKEISSKSFWDEPEQHHKWVHQDVFQLFVKNKILN